jgi:hypothetical protein
VKVRGSHKSFLRIPCWFLSNFKVLFKFNWFQNKVRKRCVSWTFTCRNSELHTIGCSWTIYFIVMLHQDVYLGGEITWICDLLDTSSYVGTSRTNPCPTFSKTFFTRIARMWMSKWSFYTGNNVPSFFILNEIVGFLLRWRVSVVSCLHEIF